MIDIDEVTFQNFLSFGPYSTTLKIAGLGPCLITGPNGAGKSSAINSLLYGLFGRTMHAARPGDRVVNRATGRDCMVTARIRGGDTITRTRMMAGHDELLVERGGSAVLSTRST